MALGLDAMFLPIVWCIPALVFVLHVFVLRTAVLVQNTFVSPSCVLLVCEGRHRRVPATYFSLSFVWDRWRDSGILTCGMSHDVSFQETRFVFLLSIIFTLWRLAWSFSALPCPIRWLWPTQYTSDNLTIFYCSRLSLSNTSVVCYHTTNHISTYGNISTANKQYGQQRVFPCRRVGPSL